MISVMPLRTSSLVTYSINGLSSISAIGFGLSLTTLRSLVPKPPANKIACILFSCSVFPFFAVLTSKMLRIFSVAGIRPMKKLLSRIFGK